MELDETKGESFQVASGDVIPNLGRTQLKGTGNLGSSPLQVGTHVAEIKKPLASVDQIVSSGMMLIMHRSRGIAKRMDSDTERKIRDLFKSCNTTVNLHSKGQEVPSHSGQM